MSNDFYEDKAEKRTDVAHDVIIRELNYDDKSPESFGKSLLRYETSKPRIRTIVVKVIQTP